MVSKIEGVEGKEIYLLFKSLSCSSRIEIPDSVNNWEKGLKYGERFEEECYDIVDRWKNRTRERL